MNFHGIGKTLQFKDIIQQINWISNTKNIDAPKVTATGTVKLHGTNAGIQYTLNEGVRVNKRKSLLDKTALTAHFGFVEYVHATYKDEIELFMKNQFEYFTYNYTIKEKQDLQLVFFGEWCGNKVQKGVGISRIPQKSFFLFEGVLYNYKTKEVVENLTIRTIKTNIPRFYNIHQFPTFSLEIDFKNPKLSQNKLAEITTEVERECPVAKELVIDRAENRLNTWQKITNWLGLTKHEEFIEELIGEGVVWCFDWEGTRYKFKVKGHKHSVSKVRTLAPIDESVIKNINEFVEYTCTENRMTQCINDVATELGIESTKLTKANTGAILKWISNDILKEESKVLEANDLTWKEVSKPISTKMRKFFFKYLDDVVINQNY